MSASYDVSPPSELLPSPDVRERFAAGLADLPGLDLIGAVRRSELTPDLPQDGFYVSGRIRPGFNGNVSVWPYQTVDYVAGRLTLEGCGLFTMVYENAQHFSNVVPSNRRIPDYVSLAGDAEIITLQNAGRLLVQRSLTEAGGATADCRIDPDGDYQGIIRVEQIIDSDQLRPLLTRLAIGMALKDPDIATFAKQPFRKIRSLLPWYQQLWRRK